MPDNDDYFEKQRTLTLRYDYDGDVSNFIKKLEAQLKLQNPHLQVDKALENDLRSLLAYEALGANPHAEAYLEQIIGRLGQDEEKLKAVEIGLIQVLENEEAAGFRPHAEAFLQKVQQYKPDPKPEANNWPPKPGKDPKDPFS